MLTGFLECGGQMLQIGNFGINFLTPDNGAVMSLRKGVIQQPLGGGQVHRLAGHNLRNKLALFFQLAAFTRLCILFHTLDTQLQTVINKGVD